MRLFVGFFLSLLCLMGSDVLDFDLIKMPTQKQAKPLVLIISGIQGDEPGGFNATNLFLQHYKILLGEVWVVPNLNRHSILRNHRGIYGDMNRKFSTLSQADKEYELIQKIKTIILNPQVQVIYHLHDGGGFYRQTYIDSLRNPNRWGNCSIIDQEMLQGAYYEDLLKLSQKITQKINQKILNDVHLYHTRNTQTRLHDKEMEKSLTYFAITHQKTALANEASKNLPLNERVYYHLLGIEGVLSELGVQFERDFKLTPQTIYSLLYNRNSFIEIENRIKLPLFDLRPRLAFFPFPKDKALDSVQFRSNQYIVGFLPRGDQIVMKYGNRVLSSLSPLYLEFSNALPEVEIEVDGKKQRLKMGDIFEVRHYFEVYLEDTDKRVNIIGFHGKYDNEINERVELKNLMKQYSIDKFGKKYRIEFYDKAGRFLGMLIADFSQSSSK
ncbi:M99 family carboxypeptidase catalytic domain-containing protein [Helicobacter pametensis]|uniref:M99 family carboxypeptidase catalytic domain-containing protein n=1 Tax=Helicobacter pametensis TaxID=95149 RepID=UPI0004B01FB1|nr:M99 family carboxypeptidase catalytic domain-containing protein [Helicobacter pametensis]